MVNVDSKKIKTLGVIDVPPTPLLTDSGPKTPDPCEAYDNYLYRIRAHSARAELEIGATSTGNDEPGEKP